MRSPRCKTPDCQGLRKSRGLCFRCYNQFAKMVNAKEISWEQLEAEGKADKAIGPQLKGFFFKKGKSP